MIQTARTAIVLRYANYRENDRMLTMLSPVHGRVEALARGCRRPRSSLLNASEPFALGDYELYEKNGRYTVTGVTLTETFYPLRLDYERLSAGIWLLGLTEEAAQPGKPAQDLFMLLLHTLSRLAFSDQPWKPLLAGFLLHYANEEGFKPRLNHCAVCGKSLEDREPVTFDLEAGGLCCHECRKPPQLTVAPEQAAWMREMLSRGSSCWLDPAGAPAPYPVLRRFVESQIGHAVRGGEAVPKV